MKILKYILLILFAAVLLRFAITSAFKTQSSPEHWDSEPECTMQDTPSSERENVQGPQTAPWQSTEETTERTMQPTTKEKNRPGMVSTTRPKPATTARPGPVTTARPGPVTTARPGPVTTARPGPVTTAQPGPEPATQPNIPGETQSNQTKQFELTVFRLVNQERRKAGVPEVGRAADLSAAAAERAKEIVRKFDHVRPDGSEWSTVYPGPDFYSAIGENIAFGQKTPEQVMDGWMNSEGHRKNILDADFTHIGVACYESGGYLYWVQAFGG